MRTIYRFGGKRISLDHAQEINGVRYPDLKAVWQSLGITEHQVDDYPDPRFYSWTENLDGTLNVVPKPLDGVRAAINEQIKAHRDYLIQTGGAKVGADWFHSDTHSKTQQIGLVMLGANLPAGLKWKTMAGTFVDMTPALVQAIFAAQVTQEQAIFAAAEAHIAALAALTTVEQIAAYDWRAGWPEVFARAQP